MERLDKVIANKSHYSRREVKALVRKGQVLVNGIPVTNVEMKIDEGTQIVVAGAQLSCTAYTYVLLHKPAGVITATEDRDQKTVLDLLPKEYRKLSPVGRLDKDTEGLLLLTDDGELNHRLTGPKYHIDKVYYAEVEGCLEPSDVTAFAEGLELKDFTCLPAGLDILTERSCLVTVREGKFHQVKRMLASRGKPVQYLKRLQMGPLKLDETLPVGGVRVLTPQEIEELRAITGLR